MSIKHLIGYAVIFSILLMGLNIQAETSVKGIADVTYKGRKAPNKKELKATKAKAVNSALSRWASKQGGSFLKNFDAIRPEIEANIKSYVLGVTTVDEQNDRDSKNYQIVVKVLIDDVRLKNAVSASSTVANVSEDDKSYMTFIFVSRRQSSVKSYDARVSKRLDTSQSTDGEDLEAGSSTGVEFSSETNTSKKVTSGGSTTRKADKIEYDVTSSSEINVAMTEIFSTNGFEVVEAEYLEEETDGLISVEAFKEDYRTGDDISGQTRRNAAKGARMVEVPYIAVGTLDIGLKDIDPSSGLTRVYVTVTGKLISVKKRFPKTVASVGPVQFAGIGPNQSVAERNALKLAAESAANELINQLNAKGIR